MRCRELAHGNRFGRLVVWWYTVVWVGKRHKKEVVGALSVPEACAPPLRASNLSSGWTWLQNNG